MFHINVWLTVRDAANVDDVSQLLVQAAKLSRQEPGCVRFEAYHSQADRRRFLLCEHWESQEAWEVHKSAQAFTEIYQPKVLPLVDREPHISDALG